MQSPNLSPCRFSTLLPSLLRCHLAHASYLTFPPARVYQTIRVWPSAHFRRLHCTHSLTTKNSQIGKPIPQRYFCRRRRDGSCLFLLLFFKFIHVFIYCLFNHLGCFHCCRQQKLGKKLSLVAKLLLVEGWSLGQHYDYTSGQLLRALHSVCCCGDKLCAVKAQECAGFHSNPVACDRLKMKGYKSLPGWPWGLATVILWGWIQPKSLVAWHADILSVLFHCEVSHIPEMWFK